MGAINAVWESEGEPLYYMAKMNVVDTPDSWCIVKEYSRSRREVVKVGLSLDDAKAWVKLLGRGDGFA